MQGLKERLGKMEVHLAQLNEWAVEVFEALTTAMQQEKKMH